MFVVQSVLSFVVLTRSLVLYLGSYGICWCCTCFFAAVILMKLSLGVVMVFFYTRYFHQQVMVREFVGQRYELDGSG